MWYTTREPPHPGQLAMYGTRRIFPFAVRMSVKSAALDRRHATLQ